MNINTQYHQFPCIPVPFNQSSPYDVQLDEFSSAERTIWINSCNAASIAQRMAGWDRLYYDMRVRQPALFVHRGWASIMLYDEPTGLALLEQAQKLIGAGRDKLFDDHLQRLHQYVEKLCKEHDEAWNRLDDGESEFWLRKWVTLRPMPQGATIATNIHACLETVKATWSELKASLSPEEAVRRYNRLLSLQTNELEGLFRLHGASISRLVRIGFFPSAVDVLQEGSLYFEDPDDAQSQVAQVCKDMLKAIQVVVSISEQKAPVDVDTVKKIHFECTFHSRFTRVDLGPPAVYALVSPGTFRQSVCTTNYEVEGKIGIVQYCSFRDIPTQMESMIGLFNQYLLALSPDSPMDALRIAAWSHAWVGQIHPFGDGNGRVGRVVSSVPLLKHGLPPINIMSSTTLDAAKEEYVDALVKAQYDDNLGPLMLVILKGMFESMEYIRKNCLVEDQSDANYKHQGGNGKTKLRIVPRVYDGSG